MSTDSEVSEMPSGTQPVAEHEWLKHLLGEWKLETEMTMGPGEPVVKGSGTESVISLGGLWSYSTGVGNMPDGASMTYHHALGYDVSFKEYRGCWIASVSSHMWRQTGELSADGRTMTLTCEGPDMEVEGKTALYRDVIELVDPDHRTMTSYGQQPDGTWAKFMVSHYTRV